MRLRQKWVIPLSFLSTFHPILICYVLLFSTMVKCLKPGFKNWEIPFHEGTLALHGSMPYHLLVFWDMSGCWDQWWAQAGPFETSSLVHSKGEASRTFCSLPYLVVLSGPTFACFLGSLSLRSHFIPFFHWLYVHSS